MVFRYRCGVCFPAEKASDPVRALPPLFVAVARKPPAAQLEANEMGRGTGAAADAVVLTDRSFNCWHTSPLNMVRIVRQFRSAK